MPTSVPHLIISGSMGAGKTTVLSESPCLLAQAGVPHAEIDLDWLSVMHPQQDAYGLDLALANLRAVWPNYAAAGAKRLIVANVVENKRELDLYRTAVHGARPIACRLTAPIALMHQRLRVREQDMFQHQALTRSTELDGILHTASVEHFTVDNGPGRLVSDVAHEILTRAGWL